MVTPEHIVPEWYFLPFYAILRALPDKVLGIIFMLFSIILLVIIPYFWEGYESADLLFLIEEFCYFGFLMYYYLHI
jgi:quinol-cytochrome oxidoreductase complex cytochrome b subunit